ncbi:hypothetical protein ZOSMA_10538G00010 [Zostera marina]|uniref:Uncharacterized protein n=1 Tax=Zostera marina TaxID=29655 RepID=A0A0K9Q4P7_ZOSMR|nr:hypothetical protein ZOSMA_10538G00010 [Zostera marina]
MSPGSGSSDLPRCSKIIFFCFLSMYRFPIVEPDSDHTRLRLTRESFEAIERITTPIAAVSFILHTLRGDTPQ